jgi:hypothetical protein
MAKLQVRMLALLANAASLWIQRKPDRVFHSTAAAQVIHPEATHLSVSQWCR